jgi:hypothetical protein
VAASLKRKARVSAGFLEAACRKSRFAARKSRVTMKSSLHTNYQANRRVVNSNTVKYLDPDQADPIGDLIDPIMRRISWSVLLIGLPFFVGHIIVWAWK